ncbi:hypothetical protein CCHL11_00164 [Colletotrichum chlorophyti]|uniref:Uncharacterized protein n=1 Tax=Colletotrichum chlorophyti TaxID=708187 RepID=A0A1Q8RUI3_9PEZI|nr:hypothetical protein CCHL11_00164 [Colletotrichum chlorophyti]
MARVVFTVVFACIFYLAKAGIYDLAVANGILKQDLPQDLIHFTSLKPLDTLLTVLVRFFQPIAEGNDLSLSLFSVFMAGQLFAVYILTVVEGLRAGNRGKLISYTTFWGMLWQLMTIGMTTPFYYLVYLYTSPIPDAQSDALAAAIAVDPLDASAVNTAVTLGAVIPTVLLGLPSPRLIAPHTQEILLAIWQAFPLWSAVAQVVVTKFHSVTNTVPKTTRQKAGSEIARLRGIYAYGLTLAASTYFGVLCFVFWDAKWGPEAALTMLGNVFRPMSPWGLARAASAEKGSLALLQWDAYCSSLAVWAWIAYLAYKRGGFARLIVDLVKLVAWTPVVGPGGAAVAVVWGRDVELARATGGKLKSG